MRKHTLKTGILLILACLVLVTPAACGGGTARGKQAFVEVIRGDITASVTGDGELSLPWQRELTFHTSGEILSVDVEEGDQVSQGQVLARLDTAALERTVKNAEIAITTAEVAVAAAQLAVASAEVDLRLSGDAIEAARIDLEQATDGFRQIAYPYTYSTFVFDVPEAISVIRDAERQIREALELGTDPDHYWEQRSQLEKAQENLIQAREGLARGTGEDVFEQQLLTVKDFWTLRSAQLAMEKSVLALTQANDNLEKAKLALDKASNDKDKAALALEKAKSDRDSATEELEKAVMYAPFDGAIARVDAKPGEVLSAASYATAVIIEIVDPSRMEFLAEVDEIDIPQVRTGQRVIISVEALPGVQIDGRVTVISSLPKEEAGVKLYEVKISFDAPPAYTLKGGMTASAEIITDEQSDVLLVPNQAITLDSQGNYVIKVSVDKQVIERSVVTGIRGSSQTQVLSGLTEGELVIVETE
ncbi:efflux RND transporter periplasmic adaptor subunit [Chloroflexota bacterium]